MTKGRILIVDDEESVVGLIHTLLEEEDYTVCGASGTGEEALNLAERERPDLVLMDINLSGELDGIETAELIRSRFEIPSIFLSGMGDRETLERAKLTEPYAFLQKPLRQRELYRAIELGLYKSRMDRRLVKSHGALEVLVEERTLALQTANEELRRKMAERGRIDEAMQKTRNTQSAIYELLKFSLDNVSLKDILTRTMDLILSIPWLSVESKGCIFLVEDNPEVLVLAVQKGLDEELIHKCRVVPFGICLCGRAAAGGRLLHVGRVDERHDIHYDGMKPHGHYCVPIVSAKKTLGVITLYIEEGHQKDLKEIKFLNAMADTLAGVITRTRAEADRKALIGDLNAALMDIRRSQKEWQTTFDSIGDLISIHDRDFTIIKANRAFADYYGMDIKEVVNKKCFEVMHGTNEAPTWCPQKETLEDGRPVTGEMRDTERNRTFRVSTYPYYSPDGDFAGIVHIARDVTEEKEAEMRLILSERLASIGQMAAGIAHEINNPLASIAGCAEGLLNRVKKDRYDPVRFEDYLGIIEEEITRCKGITTSMLSFVRKPAHEEEAVDLREAIDKSLLLIGFQGRLANVEVKSDLDPDLPPISGNESELRQALMIIMANALDAMDDRGVLTLETGRRDEKAFIRITDTGPGIPEESRHKIFDLFFTTKSKGGGTGLGLSIAMRIITRHRGTLEAFSEEGRGATFEIRLPSGSRDR